MEKTIIDDPFKYKPPVSEKLPELRFPDFQLIKIKGVKVYFIPDYSQPLFTVKALLQPGSFGEEKPGTALLTARMLLLGTDSKNAETIAEESETTGSSLKSTADRDNMVVSLTALNSQFEKSFELFSECITGAVFHGEELDRLKKKHLANIEESLSEPSVLARIALNSGLFEGHPYSYKISGTLSSVKKIELNDIKDLYGKILSYKPAFIVAGNIDLENVLKRLEKIAGLFGDADYTDKGVRFSPLIKNNKVVIIDKPDSVQASLRLGKFTVNREHPDYPALHLANIVFGGYFQSRLNGLLREKKGVTYGVYSQISNRKYSTGIVIATDVNQEETAESIKDILNEMDKISNEKISDDEYKIAMQYMPGSFVRRMETPQQIAGFVKVLHTLNLPGDYYRDFFNKILKLTVDDIFSAQKQNFKPEGLVIALCGDARQLKEKLSFAGDVYSCDTEGRLQISE